MLVIVIMVIIVMMMMMMMMMMMIMMMLITWRRTTKTTATAKTNIAITITVRIISITTAVGMIDILYCIFVWVAYVIILSASHFCKHRHYISSTLTHWRMCKMSAVLWTVFSSMLFLYKILYCDSSFVPNLTTSRQSFVATNRRTNITWVNARYISYWHGLTHVLHVPVSL